VYVISAEKHSQTYFYVLPYHNNQNEQQNAIAASPAAKASHPFRQPPSQQWRQSRASAACFCPLIFCQGGGEGLMTTTI